MPKKRQMEIYFWNKYIVFPDKTEIHFKLQLQSLSRYVMDIEVYSNIFIKSQLKKSTTLQVQYSFPPWKQLVFRTSLWNINSLKSHDEKMNTSGNSFSIFLYTSIMQQGPFCPCQTAENAHRYLENPSRPITSSFILEKLFQREKHLYHRKHQISLPSSNFSVIFHHVFSPMKADSLPKILNYTYFEKILLLFI